MKHFWEALLALCVWGQGTSPGLPRPERGTLEQGSGLHGNHSGLWQRLRCVAPTLRGRGLTCQGYRGCWSGCSPGGCAARGPVVQDRVDGPGLGGDPHDAREVLAEHLAEEVVQDQLWRQQDHDAHRALLLLLLVHDGLQAPALPLRHRLVGLGHGQRLPEGDADVAAGRAIAEQLAVVAAAVAAAHQRDDPVPAEVQHQLHHGLDLVIGARRCAQKGREALLVP